jgi:hypothetical protein
MLPAAYRTMHASRTGRALLCACATHVKLFSVHWRWARGRGGRGDGALNDERWAFAVARTSDQNAKTNDPDRSCNALKPMRSDKTRATLVAKPAAGPNTPTQAHDLVATFATEVWTITREERQACEALSKRSDVIRGWTRITSNASS